MEITSLTEDSDDQVGGSFDGFTLDEADTKDQHNIGLSTSEPPTATSQDVNEISQVFSAEGIVQLDIKPLQSPKVLMSRSNTESEYLNTNPLPGETKIKELKSIEYDAKMSDPPIMDKQIDPGAFTLPCSIMGITSPTCIVDTGAAICVIPLSVTRQLGLSSYNPCEYTVRLADETHRKAHGILENVPLEIGGIIVPTEFVVLDMGDEGDGQILLGRPFLTATKALINMDHQWIELTLGKGNKMRFGSDGNRLPPDRPPGVPRSGVNLGFLLEPVGNDEMEYVVRGGRQPKPPEGFRQNQSPCSFSSGSSGPFGIGRTPPAGKTAIMRAKGTELPYDGQKVQLYLTPSDEEDHFWFPEIERTPSPLNTHQ